MVSFTALHAVYDPLFGGTSHPADTPLVTSDPLALDETSFSASEAEHALRSLHKRAAPGPDGITTQELKKISFAAQALIMRNW